MKTFLPILLAFGLALVIGCGGSGDDFGGFTGGVTSGNTGTTSGDDGEVSRFAGEFFGSLSGSNTTGARFNGDGYASISPEGEAFFWFDALAGGGAPYSRDFEGTLSANGHFTGWTHTGEPVTGTATINGDRLAATLTWVKRTASGQVFYTETSTFDLFRD